MSTFLSGRRGARLSSAGIVWLALVGLLVAAAIVFSIADKSFFSSSTASDVLNRSSLLGFIAIGQTLVILGRSLDLSVGYVAALSSMIAGTVIGGDDSRIALGIGATLLVAAGIGLINGLVVTVLRVNPFIATVGMGFILKAVLDVYFSSNTGSGSVPPALQSFGLTRIGPVPISTAVMVMLAVIAAMALQRTRFGAHLFAVGGSDGVARLSGVRTTRTLIWAHVLCSLLAGVAGLLIAARQGTGSVDAVNSGLDLNSVAAVVLGGTLLMGGRGSVSGTIAGVLVLAVLESAFGTFQFSAPTQGLMRGAIIILAVALYARRQIDPFASRARFADTGRRISHDVPVDPEPSVTDSPAPAGGSR